jgi:Tol biopolymer transport system component
VRKLNVGVSSARWSPTGRRLVAIARGEIYVVNADGRRLKRLTRTRVSEYYPTWSPDGRWILFVSVARRGGNPDLFKMRPNGRGRRRLAPTPFCESQPAWSPDSTRIAFLDACRNDALWPL